MTVASSGDHVLLSLLNGAENVETYDINNFAKYYQELKISGYNVLEFQDFINFFYTDKGFTYDIFEKITNLPEEVKDFWQYLFDYNDDYEIIDSQLFSNYEYSYDVLRKYHPFLDENYFNKNKTINNLTFYQCDALNLPTILKKKYDVIILSSIPNFIKEFTNLDKFNLYLEKLSRFLNKDGYIICNYLYCANDQNGSIFHNEEIIKSKCPEINKITFPSLNVNYEDAVLI